jgi:uncharacterized protein with HEPN domain
MSDRKTLLYLTDILEAIRKIETFVVGVTFEAFSQDAKTIDAVVHNIEVIGEAARHIPEQLRLAYPAVPWKQVVGSRDKMIHEYFGIDLEVIWQTINDDLPVLKQEVKAIISKQRS